MLRYLAGGVDDVRRAARLSPFAFLGAGLLLATVTVLVPLAFGGTLLEHGSFGADAPVLGSVKVTSALVLDSGVYLVVVGLVLLVLTSLGATGDGPVGPAPAEAAPEEVDA
ncbi:MAG: MnhB domain-containing protein [Acidimicrobiales bacterium]